MGSRPLRKAKLMRFKNPDPRNLVLKKVRDKDLYRLVDKGILRWRKKRILALQKGILDGSVDSGVDYFANAEKVRKGRITFPGAPLPLQARQRRRRLGYAPKKIDKLFEE